MRSLQSTKRRLYVKVMPFRLYVCVCDLVLAPEPSDIPPPSRSLFQFDVGDFEVVLQFRFSAILILNIPYIYVLKRYK
jgi:hypothetical protein